MKQSPHKKHGRPVFAPQDLDDILTSRIIDHSQQTVGHGNPADSSKKKDAESPLVEGEAPNHRDRWVGIAIAAVVVMVIIGAAKYAFRLMRGK